MDNEIINIFLQESKDHLNKSNAAVMELEKNGILPDQIKILKSEIHTLKGDSRMLGFASISDASHRIEDYILLLDGADEALVKKAVKAIFKILDLIQNAVDALPGEKTDIDLSHFDPAKLKGGEKTGDHDQGGQCFRDRTETSPEQVGHRQQPFTPHGRRDERPRENQTEPRADRFQSGRSQTYLPDFIGGGQQGACPKPRCQQSHPCQ